MKRIRVLIADDHAVVRMGFASLLGTVREVEVVGDAFDGEDAVRKALALRPDVVVMDLVMPRKDGASATAELREKAPDVKVLVLMGATGPRIEAALRALPDFHEGDVTILHAQDMPDAVNQARAAAHPGDVVSLSPASASFDKYPNFEARGREYKEIVRSLK